MRWNHWPTTGPAPFVGSLVGDVTLASTPIIGNSAYSPVNGYLYLAYGSTVVVCDLSGTPSIVTTISVAAAVSRIAYLPISNKIFVLQASAKFQLIDCVTNTAAAQVTMGAGFTGSPAICSSFSVDPSNDDVYMVRSFQIGKVAPGTGVVTASGFGSPAYTVNISNPADLAFNPADGLLYLANNAASHMLMVISPAGSTSLVNDFGATPTDITGGSKTVLNRLTNHVYVNAIGGAKKLYVMTNSTTLVTISPANETGSGDYDSVLQQVFETENTSPGFIDVYDNTDTLLTHTDISGTMVNAPQAIYCAPLAGRYAVQKASSGNVLKVIAR